MYTFRIPADREYLCLLGRAVYNFATYEWMIVWTLEKLAPGSLNKCTKLTANKIAELFGDVLGSSNNLVPPARLEALIQVRREFERLVEIRDQLLHAHPCTAPSGAQQLFYSGGRHSQMEWPLRKVEQAAIDFENASIEANNLFYNIWPIC